MRSAAIVGAALILVGGCDGGGEPRKAGTIAVAEGGYKARIDALDERQRNAVFLRAVRDAGHSCQSVAGSAYGGLEFGMPSWVARCGDGSDWLVMLDKGGRALGSPSGSGHCR